MFALSSVQRILASNERLFSENGQPFSENTITCYYPIITNDMCLQCHGKMGSTMTQQTYTKIKSVYAEDKAIGYSENELRGIWVVEMDK